MSIQVTFDTADPHAQAEFWAAALGYEVENRVHIDIPVSDDQKLAEVQRLTGLGARLLWETADRGARTYTMQDPEGNEFCLH